MRPFEALYGRKCPIPLRWSQLEDSLVLGLNLLQEMEKMVKKIKQNVKDAQDKHKLYADLKRTPKEFQVREHVYLRVQINKSSLNLGSYSKLDP